MGRFEGEGSYIKLISKIYGENKDKVYSVQYKDYDAIMYANSSLTQHFLSFIRAGEYQNSETIIRKDNGFLWTPHVVTDTNVRDLNSYNYNVLVQTWASEPKGYGFSVRCVAK